MKIIKNILLITFLLFAFSLTANSQTLFFIAPNTTVVSTPGCDIEIDGTIEISTSASYTHNGNTHLTGDWTNNGGWASASSGTATFHAGNLQHINGTTSSYFYNLEMDKTDNNPGTRLRVMLPTQCFNNAYMVLGNFEVILNLNKFKVNKIVRNEAIIENFGIIEIGEP
ncbi:MAG: hypothetical protein V1779_13220 [bacterium]